MARFYYGSARGTTNGAKKISVFWLRKKGFLTSDKCFSNSGLTWSSDNVPTGNISFHIDTDEDKGAYMRFIYRIKKHSEPEENYKDMDYRFTLETVPCHYGGKRWFFKCGLYKANRYCGRRVAILYEAGDYFGCRYCAELSYDSCNEGKRFKGGYLGLLSKSWKTDEYYETLKRRFYKGKPTRKYRKYLRMSHISDGELFQAEQALRKFLPNKN